MFSKTILDNGLRIIAVPQKNTQAVTVLVLVGTGSKYEKKELNGISHFLEHLFFKGTKKRPSQLSVAEPLDRVGGIYNAFTAEEYTGYFVKVDAKHFDLTLDIISDIFLNSKLGLKEIEKERGVIIEEINMYYDHPSSYVQNLWNRVLYGDQPAGWDIAGAKETVSKISRHDLIKYMENQYVAPNTIICVAGNISDKKKTIYKIKKYFSEIGTRRSFGKVKVVERQQKPECLLQKKETDQTHFCLGTRGYNLFHPQKYTFEILGDILGGMMSSRLFIKIREKMGVAYYITTSVSAFTDTGYLVTQAGVDNKKIDEAILAILEEYKKISQEKVPAKELKKAKDHLKGRIALLLETSDVQASFYGLQEILEKKILTPKEICDKIDKVKANDVLEIAKDIFRPKNLNLALIGPFGDKARFEKLLHF